MVSKAKRVLNALVRRSYWYNNVAFPDCEKFWKHNTFELDVVNLGSSSALAAFNYSDFPRLKTANWAMAPQSLVGDYEILRNYSCFLREGATVIISLCPFSCLGGSNNNLADKYYTVLDIASMPHASYVKKQQMMEIKQNPILYYPLFQLFSRKPKQKTANWCEEELEKDAKMRMESWRKEFSIIRFTDPLSIVNIDAYSDGEEIIGKIIDYCKERNFCPVVVMPPVSEALRQQFTPEMKKLYIDSFVKFLSKKEVLFLDHFSDTHFQNDCFQNSFVLNGRGAKLFTNVLLKEIGIL